MAMFDWEPHGIEEETGFFSTIMPHDILYDFDGPRLFTFEVGRRKFLAYLCDEITDRVRHIVVPTDDWIIAAVKADRIAVRDALTQPWAWIVETDGQGEALMAQRIAIRTLPEAILPEPGIMLHPTPAGSNPMATAYRHAGE